MSWEVRVRPAARRNFQELPANVQNRVMPRLVGLAADPRPHGVQKLSGDEGFHRIRAGDYRIVYAIDDPARVVWIVKIGHRGDVYRRR